MFDVALAEEIWTAKYRFRPDEVEGDGSFAATAERVARAVALVEAPEQRALWEDRFREAIKDFRVIPAGRVLAGAGTAVLTAEPGAGKTPVPAPSARSPCSTASSWGPSQTASRAFSSI